MAIDIFTRQYLITALWSTNDESDERGGEPMDANYGIDDIAPEALEKAITDCERFQRENADDIATWNGNDDAYSQAGHDFWLTRNGHGCGFWESEWDDGSGAGKRLTEASNRMGGVNPYVDDDGKIHGF